MRNRHLVWLLALFLATLLPALPAAPADPPPDGFAWEELKEIRAWMPRPEGWFFRRVLPAMPFFNFSPRPFTDAFGVQRGVSLHMMARTGRLADDLAVTWINANATQHKVLRGWTRKGVPAGTFTTYGVVVTMRNEETQGVEYTCECVLVANHVTGAVYQCWLVAPTAEWPEVEATGETMLANLRLDPEF